MPTEHKKKKVKKEKKLVPKLLIKNEPNELHPLSHYVNDRVELVRQIFTSMKSKTINSIRPDFLQDKDLEELQEICLDELLGISKKRLLSIINATKCPSDTDSSDSNSDVEKIEEHISLEEISSDSNDEIGKSKRKRKVPATTSKSVKAVAEEKNGKPEKKQYSVLELLELQARARAIRSQLALEPVTKIELHSDDEENTAATKKVVAIPAKETPESSATEQQPCQKSIESIESHLEPEKTVSTRPVRLKRNFRKRQLDEESTESNLANTEMPTSNEPEATNGKPETSSPKQAEEPQNIPEKSRSSTPDIIPIIEEPEILCISSSESDNENSSNSKRRYISFPTVTIEKGPPTEDELFLLKIKEKSITSTTIKGNTDSVGKSSETVSEVQETGPKDSNTSSAEKQTDEHIETEKEILEEGEIIEEDTEIHSEKCDTVKVNDVNSSSSSDSSPDEHEENSLKSESTRSDAVAKTNKGESIDGELEENNSQTSQNPTAETPQQPGDNDERSPRNSDGNENSRKSSNVDKDQRKDSDDEDIIDLGKDEDLDFEMKEMPAEKNASKVSDKNSKQSSSQEVQHESWDKRWLRGRKVTDVLATSKLASKVRSKIREKKSKAKNIPQPEEKLAEPEQPMPDQVLANVEVGSVEHYKELTKNQKE